METASSRLALAESSTPLSWCTVARTGAQHVGDLTNQCFAKFAGPHPKRYLLALYQIEEKTLYLVDHVNIWVQYLQLWQGSLKSWNFKLECKSPFEDQHFFFFFFSWNDHNIDFLMKLIRVQKKKEQRNMGSNDKWDERQNISRRPPNDFTKSQIRRSDHIFSRKSQSIAIYSCLREFSPNGRASLLQGKWLRNGSLLQLY